MTKFTGSVLFVAVLFSGLLYANRGDAQELVFEITIDDSGFYPDDNGQKMPNYTLEVGDVYLNEKRSFSKYDTFGPFATNGTIYTRYPGDRDLWYGVFWRTPVGEEEEGRFYAEVRKGMVFEKSEFYSASKPNIPGKVLPPPFDHLTNWELRNVFMIVRYPDGSMKLAFIEGTMTRSDVIEFLSKVVTSWSYVIKVKGE